MLMAPDYERHVTTGCSSGEQQLLMQTSEAVGAVTGTGPFPIPISTSGGQTQHLDCMAEPQVPAVTASYIPEAGHHDGGGNDATLGGIVTENNSGASIAAYSDEVLYHMVLEKLTESGSKHVLRDKTSLKCYKQLAYWEVSRVS